MTTATPPTIIDPLAVVLAHVRQHPAVAALCGIRVAAKHKYGLGLAGDTDTAPDVWETAAPAIRIQVAGGTPDIDTRRQTVDLSVTCFGRSQVEAMEVYGAFMACCRETQRTRVATAAGNGLLYYLVTTVPPQFGFEPISEQIGIDTVTCTATAAIAECAIA